MKIRKLSVLILTFAVVLSLVPSAFATGETPTIIDETELDNWMNQYIADNGLGDGNKVVSVGFVYTKTGDEYYYNADEFMYSASLYKVPVSMMLSEKEAAGEITQDSEINGMTVSYLERTAIVDSNNDSGHYIADYVGEGISAYDTYSGKDADLAAKKYAPDIEESYYAEDFYELSYYTARFMTNVMNTLFKGGDEAYPYIISYLKQAQPDYYFNTSLKGVYEVAQKYGAYEEPNGIKDNHCAAIIYTPTPIIVVVMTKNVTEYNRVISEIGAHLAEYAVQLDSKPVPTPEPEAEAEATPEITSEIEIQTTPELIEVTGQPVAADDVEEKESKLPYYLFGIIPVLIIIIVLALKQTKKSAEEEEIREILLERQRAKKKAERYDASETDVRNQRTEKYREETYTSEKEDKSKGKYVPKH